jgi:hypothetical protein
MIGSLSPVDLFHNKFGWKGKTLLEYRGCIRNRTWKAWSTSQQVFSGPLLWEWLIGIEMTEMLLSRNIPVTFLVREKNFWDIVLPKKIPDDSEHIP